MADGTVSSGDEAEGLEPRPFLKLSWRQRLFLLLLIVIAGVAGAPEFDELKAEPFYFAIILTLGLVGIGAANRSGLSPMRLVESDRSWIVPAANKILRDGLVVGILCLVISYLIVEPQHWLLGHGPTHAVDPARLARRRWAIEQIRQMEGWKYFADGVLSAPIREEVFDRLFFVSGIAWLMGKVFRVETPARSRIIEGCCILLGAIEFGFTHVIFGQSVAWWCPLPVQILLDTRTCDGAVLAWVYWNRGIETSMVAHASVNLFFRARRLL